MALTQRTLVSNLLPLSFSTSPASLCLSLPSDGQGGVDEGQAQMPPSAPMNQFLFCGRYYQLRALTTEK